MLDCHEAIDCGREMFRGPDEEVPVAATLAHCLPPTLRLQERAVIHWRWFSEKSYENVVFEHVALSAKNPQRTFLPVFRGQNFPFPKWDKKTAIFEAICTVLTMTLMEIHLGVEIGRVPERRLRNVVSDGSAATESHSYAHAAKPQSR